jgi:hypothetical protein
MNKAKLELYHIKDVDETYPPATKRGKNNQDLNEVEGGDLAVDQQAASNPKSEPNAE